jgi:hypothetical protein
LISKTRIVVISTTLDTDELFSPVQLITVPFRFIPALDIIIVDTNGRTVRGESLEIMIFIVFTLIGKITGLWPYEEILLISCSEGWLVVITLHSRKVWFVLQTRECCSSGHNNIDSPRPVPARGMLITANSLLYSNCY